VSFLKRGVVDVEGGEGEEGTRIRSKKENE
jgi:hypothetical protein